MKELWKSTVLVFLSQHRHSLKRSGSLSPAKVLSRLSTSCEHTSVTQAVVTQYNRGHHCFTTAWNSSEKMSSYQNLKNVMCLLLLSLEHDQDPNDDDNDDDIGDDSSY